MGGSRRRLKKSAPKVKVGLSKRKKIEKTRVPKEVAESRPAFQNRLKAGATWKELDTLTENYTANGLVLDANALAPRQKGGARPSIALVQPAERSARGDDTFEDDDELRAGCNLERKTGKAPPPRLTSTQRKIIEALRAAHGEDVHAMMLDRKINSMQHSEGQLKKLMAGYDHWNAPGQKTRHDFWSSNKPPKRLL